MRDLLGINISETYNQAKPTVTISPGTQQDADTFFMVAMLAFLHDSIDLILESADESEPKEVTEEQLKHEMNLAAIYSTDLQSAEDIWEDFGAKICAKFGCLKGHEKEAARIVQQALLRNSGLPNGEWSIHSLLEATNPTVRELYAPDPYAPNAQLSQEEIFSEACQLAGFILWRAIELACSIIYSNNR